MPIYEYQCQNCEHRFEKLQKISDEPLKRCPSCEKDKLKKLVSAAAFRLKGNGWYETDFKGGKKKNLHGAENTSSNNSNGSNESKAAPAANSDSGSSNKPKSA